MFARNVTKFKKIVTNALLTSNHALLAQMATLWFMMIQARNLFVNYASCSTLVVPLVLRQVQSVRNVDQMHRETRFTCFRLV